MNRDDMITLHAIMLFIILAMSIWQQAHAGPGEPVRLWGEYHVGSNHSDRYYTDTDGTRKEFNERNTGGGISYAISEHAELGAGFFRNSYNKTSVYAGIDVHTNAYRPVRVGVSLAPITGYVDTPTNTRWMVVPNVVFGSKNVRTKVGYIPFGKTKVMTLTVGIGF